MLFYFYKRKKAPHKRQSKKCAQFTVMTFIQKDCTEVPRDQANMRFFADAINPQRIGGKPQPIKIRHSWPPGKASVLISPQRLDDLIEKNRIPICHLIYKRSENEPCLRQNVRGNDPGTASSTWASFASRLKGNYVLWSPSKSPGRQLIRRNIGQVKSSYSRGGQERCCFPSR